MNWKSLFGTVAAVLAVWFALGVPAFVYADETIDSRSFVAYATFTASGYAGTEELEEFPVLVRLSENSPEGFTYDNCAHDGSDIRFTDVDDRLIAHEIDTWNPAGESLIWVSVPKLTSRAQFRMYVGGDGSAPTLPASSVWLSAGYHFVNHNNVTASTVGMDSAGSLLVGAPYNGALAVETLSGAPMGKVENQTNNHGWNVNNDAMWSAHGGQVTISTWSYRTDVTDGTNRELMGVKGAYHLVNNNPNSGKCQLCYGGTTLVEAVMPVAAGNWMQITATLNGTEAKAYQNGVLLGTGTSTAIASVTEKLSCGSEYAGNSRNKGYFDEWRLRWEASSPDWVKAEYDTVMNPGFLEGVMGSAPLPVPDDWENSFTIKLGADLKSTLYGAEETDFPLLVRLSESRINGFKYSDFMQPDHSDLVFVDADGNFLDYEVDTWNSSGTSLVWVRIPVLNPSVEITCRYRGPRYRHNPAKTWKGYIGVWHMNEAGGNAADSTGHGLDGVPTGFNTALMVGETSAPTGRGRVNQTVAGSKDTASNRLSVPNYNAYITDHSKFTVSGWFKSTDMTGYPRPLSRKTSYGEGSGWEIQYESGSATSVSARGSDGNGVVTMEGPDVTEDWICLTFVYNGTTGTSYGNGGLQSKSGTVVAVKTRNEPMAIGNNSNGSEQGWCGMYDEVRLYDGAMSGVRVALDYQTIKLASPLTFGAVQKPDPDMPRLTDCEVTVNENGDLVVSGTVQRHAANVTVTLTDDRRSIDIDLGEIAAYDTFNRVLSADDGLVRFTSYTVSIVAANGGKAAAKEFTEPVRYGKITMVDFNYKLEVTVPAGFTASPLANFPLLVRLSDAIAGFDYSLFQQSGVDLMVFDADGNPVPHELENWDITGESRLWVQLPTVSDGTRFTVCFGSDSEVEAKSGMWAEYASVLHMNDTVPGGSSVKDSTGNAVPTLNAQASSDAGRLGAGFTMGLVKGNNGACVTVPVSARLNQCKGIFTASAWTKLNAAPGWGYLMSRKDADKTPSWGLQFRGASNGGTADGLSFYTAGDADTKQVLFKPLTVFRVDDWVKWTAVYNGTELSLYLNGVKFATQTTSYGVAANGDYPLCVGGFASSANTGTLPAAFDEARVKIGAVGADWVAAEYRQETNAKPLVYDEVVLTDPSVPVVDVPVLHRNDDGSYDVSVTVRENLPKAGSVKLIYDFDTVIPMTTVDSSVPAVYVASFTPTTSDKTELVEVALESEGGASRRVSSPAFYTGGLQLERIANAAEKGLSNGIVRVSRADEAFDLAVNLEILDTTTAVEGANYVAFSLSTAIPAGERYVDLEIHPLMDISLDEDTWIDIGLAGGLYSVNPTKATARVVIVNYEIPAGANFWCAAEAGRASDPHNWTAGVPDAYSTVAFDGDISNADCEWDITATHTVKSWIQSENYAGTVTLGTTFDDVFPKLTVTENMNVLGGTINHRQHDSIHAFDDYRVCLDVGGNLVVGARAAISARGLGSYGPRPEGESCYGGGYNGACSWGSLKEPNAVGSSANDNGSFKCRAGGAIWIEVAGAVSLAGAIEANGIKAEGATGDTHAGSGGSVYLKCAKLVGTGRISAKCENTVRGKNVKSAAGGRISVLLTDGELDTFAYTQFDAGAGYASYENHGGTGTVLVRSPEKPNGILYLRDSSDKYGADGYRTTSLAGRLTEVVAGESWVLDGIVFGDNGVLCVPSGTSLELVNGFGSVVSDAADYHCGIIVDNGVLIVPDGDQVMSGKWTLTSRNENPMTTIYGNLSMMHGANLGSIALGSDRIDNSDVLPLYGKCSLRVTGDLIVDADATLYARQCGLSKDKNTLSSGFSGLLSGHTHGGRAAAYKGKDALGRMYLAYDSVFAPSLPGCSVPWPSGMSAEASGGVITLDIGGRFAMNGKANVSGDLDVYASGDDCSGGTGGAIDITAGSIAGTGSILANGGVKQAVCGAGGRIAIKLTDEGADFSAFKGSILASGRIANTSYDKASSSGTVFLKTGADFAKGGTIRIATAAGNRNLANPSSTEIFSLGYGGDGLEDYKGLALEIRDFGFAAVNTDLQMSSVNLVDGDSRLDLEGRTFTVGRAWFRGSKVPVGTYRVGDDPFGSQLVDSVGDGRLRVTGFGLWVFVQ